VNTVRSPLAFPTHLSIRVKAGLAQTLPVLARLEAHLVQSWSEGVAGYQSRTASVLIRVSGKISDNIMTYLFSRVLILNLSKFDPNHFGQFRWQQFAEEHYYNNLNFVLDKALLQ